MQNLIDGYKRFRETGWPSRQKMFEELAQSGQRPRALVIACVDSRVDPGMIFDAKPGEILVIRNVANLVPPYAPDGDYHGTSAALEFGVRVLEIPHVIVLGHGSCGGVKALIEGAPLNARDFVASWMRIADSAKAKSMRYDRMEDRERCCEHEVVKLSLDNLRTFPWIVDRIDAGLLTLHGGWFAIHTGILTMLQPDGTFAPVAAA